MTAIFGVPFRRPAKDRIRVLPWLIGGDNPTALPEILPDWDYNTELVLARSVSIDGAGIRGDVDLDPEDSIALAAVWSSPGSFQRGLLCRVEITDAAEYVLSGSVRGREASAAIRLETFLILSRERAEGSKLSPVRAGSILWSDTADVLVEGTTARFPVEVIDFSQAAWAPNDAAWLLSWNRLDFHQPFLGAVRLFINSQHERVVRAVSGNPEDAEAVAVRSCIYSDVGRALVRGALEHEEFLARRELYEPGTIGRSIANLLRLLFPNESPEGLKGLMEERADYFESLLQARLQLFRY